jgi:hypothetical protein
MLLNDILNDDIYVYLGEKVYDEDCLGHNVCRTCQKIPFNSKIIKFIIWKTPQPEFFEYRIYGFCSDECLNIYISRNPRLSKNHYQICNQQQANQIYKHNILLNIGEQIDILCKQNFPEDSIIDYIKKKYGEFAIKDILE